MMQDSFNVKGSQTTIGYVSFLSRPPASTNSTLVSLLWEAGAVFYCKTNLPQSMMTADSHNNVFGRTLNPHKLCLTSGGSTGGEGSLIAMRGSILGMATDIAGSCRIPAICCGLKSFKPSAGRVPFGGGVGPGRLGSPGAIVPVIGPMGWSMRDAELAMRTICNADTWKLDENVLGVPWRHVDPVARPLRFGLIRGHPKRPLHPPIARALHSAATKLKDNGHVMVLLDDKIPDLWESAVLAWKYFLLDPRKVALQHIKAGGEPFVPSIATARFEETDGWEPSLDALWDMNVERGRIVKVWHDIMVEHELDAVLMAGYQATAVPHDQYGVPIYTVLQNLINVSREAKAAANPADMSSIRQAYCRIWRATKSWTSHSSRNPLSMSRPVSLRFLTKTAVADELQDNADTFEGVPAHLQVMGKPMKDEELVEILKIVEGILAGNTE